jgi:chromosome segregation ATPase
MIESMMYFTGGFFLAGVLALILVSFVHHRAVRLTQRRLEDALPISIAEIQAERDLQRADFAMQTRRLEMKIAQLDTQSATQQGDVARKAEAINRLKSELAQQATVVQERDAQIGSLTDQLRESRQQHAEQVTAFEVATRALADKEAELAAAAAEIAFQRRTADARETELTVLQTELERSRSRIDQLEAEAGEAAQRRIEEQEAAAASAQEVEDRHLAENALLRARIEEIAERVVRMSTDRSSPQAAEAGGEAASSVPADGHASTGEIASQQPPAVDAADGGSQAM